MFYYDFFKLTLKDVLIGETYNGNIYFSLLHYEFEAVGKMKKGIVPYVNKIGLFSCHSNIEAGADLRLRLMLGWVEI